MSERLTSHSSGATALGVLAIVIWGASIAVVRGASESLGFVTAAAIVHLTGGAIGCAIVAARPGAMRRMLGLPRRYLLVGGGFFVLHISCFYAAVGLAANRAQVVEVGVINYLWPGLTLVFSVPLLGKRARPTLVLGLLLALTGVYLTTVRDGSRSPAAFAGRIASNPLPYAIALVAACSWPMYSNLTRRWVEGGRRGAAPLFLLATGFVFGAALPFVSTPPVWSSRAVAEVSYLVLVVTLLAYVSWDTAMRRGHVTLVAALSYSIPLVSTMITCLYLGEEFTWLLLLACLFVIGGACLCKWSVVEPAQPEEPDVLP